MNSKQDKDPIRDAFASVRSDMDYLNSEVSSLREDLIQTKEELSKVIEILNKITEKIVPSSISGPNLTPTHNLQNTTTPTHNPTHSLPFKALKPQNMPFSTGNRGVPTDRQTNQQTDQHIQKTPIFDQNLTSTNLREDFSPLKDPIDDAARILDSLDSIKKEIRIKFKQLTEQEMLVFSTLYQVEEETGQADYKSLSVKLGLTESSIRDYIGRLLKKGIPVEKTKLNNKQVLLSISKNLKKITSLSTILQLRGI